MEKSDPKANIIVVDDDKNTLMSMSKVFRKEGYRVEACLSAPEALEIAEKNDFDVALLDINMPGMNGLDLQKRMKVLYPEMGVVYVTGNDHPDYALTAANQRVAGYMVKPLDMPAVLSRVEVVVKEQQLKREIKNLNMELKTTNKRILELNTELEEKVIKRTAQLKRRNDELSREVDQRRKAEEKLCISEALLRSIIDNAPDAVVTFDVHGKMQQYNYAAESIFHYTRNEAKSVGLRKLIPGILQVKEGMHPVASGEIQETLPDRRAGETQGVRKNGEKFPLYYSVSRVPLEGGKTFFIGVMQDITERALQKRRLEEALRVSQESNEDKIKMAGSIAHEVGNPVNTIVNLGNMAKRQADSITSEDLRRYLKGIVESGNRISEFMRELIIFSNLQAGNKPYVIERADIIGLINSILETFFEFEEELAEKRVSFVKGMKREDIPMDKKYIAYVLRNLIGNALKYTDKGEEVTVEAQTFLYKDKKLSEKRVKVSVIDRGRGVPDEDKEIIFNRFHQGRAADSRKKMGSGIGLSVAKDVIEAHGGDIWCEDNPMGKGTIFSFTLPMEGR